jgi:hypothetical protein
MLQLNAPVSGTVSKLDLTALQLDEVEQGVGLVSFWVRSDAHLASRLIVSNAG